MWLLDTTIFIALIKRQPPELIGKLKKHKPGDVAISSITLAELPVRRVEEKTIGEESCRA